MILQHLLLAGFIVFACVTISIFFIVKRNVLKEIESNNDEFNKLTHEHAEIKQKYLSMKQ